MSELGMVAVVFGPVFMTGALGIVLVRATDAPLSRRDYAVRILIGVVAFVATSIASQIQLTSPSNAVPVLPLILLAVSLVCLLFMCRWVAGRLLDAGMSKWLALLFVVLLASPFLPAKVASGCLVVVLCFLPPQPPKPAAGTG